MEEDAKIEREEKRNSREREEDTGRQITKKREAEERILTQKEGPEKKERKEEKEPKIIKEDKEELKRPTLTDDERLVLIVLDFVNRYKSGSGLKITGFQVKDFLEVTFPSKNVDELYSELKKKGFISETNGFEEFWITYESRVELEKAKKLIKPVLENVAKVLREHLNKNELLKSVLILSYLGEWKIKTYLSIIKDKFSKIEQVLVVFFFNREFLELLVIGKIVRHLIQERRELIKEKLEELCKEPDFLKALVMLNFEEVKRKIGIETITSNWYRNYKENISLLVEEPKVGDILSKLLFLGITESENLFEINIDEVLLKEENVARIKELLIFDGEEFKKKLEDGWSWLIGAKKALEGVVILTRDEIREFVKLNAFLLSKNGILVNKELKGVYDEVYNKIGEKLREKVSNIPNVVILSFYDKSQLANEKGKIIITLEGNIESENVLEKNVVLKISPKEIEMTTQRNKNEEYNALGKILNLNEAKSKFNLCEWVSKDEEYCVRKAREIIEDKKIPRISPEEAVEEVKKDFRLVQMLFIIADKHTSPSGMRYYSESDMWRNVLLNMQRLHPNLAEGDFEDLKNNIISIAKKARMDLSSFSDTEFVYKNWKEEIDKEIIRRVHQLDGKSKKTLYTFLILASSEKDFTRRLIWYFDWGNWNFKFPSLYQLMFHEKFNGDKEDLWDLIGKVGLGIEATWIHSQGPQKGKELTRHIVDFLSEVKDGISKELEKEVNVKEPDLESFKEKFRDNLIELVGLDYLVSSNGYCKREELRDFLVDNVSPQAWNKFESFEGVVSPKNDIIIVNLLLIDKLKDFIKNRKKELIEQKEHVKNLILLVENIDHKIQLDEELGIYKGFIITTDKEEIKVIIAPWYLPSYDSYFGNKTLIMITGQEEYETFIKAIKERSEKLTVFFFEDKILSIYSSFGEYDFGRAVIPVCERTGYKVKNKEFEFEELEEMTMPTEKKVVSEEISSEKATQIATDVEEGSILDEIFTPLSRETFSSLFATASYGPRCVLLIGDQKQGKKIIEDLAKEELKYWGNYNPRLKQIETIKKGEGGVKEAVEIVSDPEMRVISISISQEYLGWIAKIIEKLKEVETQGLKYVIFSLEEVSAEMISKIEEETSIPTCILDLPSGKRIPEIKRKILSLFGEGIELPLEAGDNLNTFWNFLQKEMLDIVRRMRKKISRDEELKDITLLKNESIPHYVLRGLTCRYLRQKSYKVNVETPEKTEEGQKVPDLTAFNKKNKTFFVEAETCVPTTEEKDAYGSNIIDPYKRLVIKMQKYKGKEGDHLILVVPNIFAFIHREVLDGLRNYIKSKLEMKVSIHMINWASYPARLDRII